MPHYHIDENLNIELKKGQTKPKKNTTSNFLLAKYMNVGYYVVTPLLAGVFLGLVLDRYLNTKPLFTISLLLFGVVGTFYNLYKLTQDKF